MISDEQRQNRAVIDAVRAILGKAPLYSTPEHSTSGWLAEQELVYYASLETTPKGKTRP